MNELELASRVAVAALVWAEVRPVWLSPWYIFLLWIEGYVGDTFTKPIGGCTMCTAGFWTLAISIYLDPPNVVFHVTSASIAILLGAIITKVFQWTQQ